MAIDDHVVITATTFNCLCVHAPVCRFRCDISNALCRMQLVLPFAGGTYQADVLWTLSRFVARVPLISYLGSADTYRDGEQIS